MADWPRRGGTWDRVRRALGKTYLALFGWRVVGEMPDAPRIVAIAAPHTSYWDFPHMIAFGFATGQYIRFLMKHTLFEGPLGGLLRAMGGIPVDRRQPQGLVESVRQEMDKHDQVILVVAPEGTRERGDYWKSGFYRLAQGAQVPIGLGFLDYGRREVGYGPTLHPTGDLAADMEQIEAFYADKQARHPEQQTPPRVREQDV